MKYAGDRALLRVTTSPLSRPGNVQGRPFLRLYEPIP